MRKKCPQCLHRVLKWLVCLMTAWLWVRLQLVPKMSVPSLRLLIEEWMCGGKCEPTLNGSKKDQNISSWFFWNPSSVDIRFCHYQPPTHTNTPFLPALLFFWPIFFQTYVDSARRELEVWKSEKAKLETQLSDSPQYQVCSSFRSQLNYFSYFEPSIVLSLISPFKVILRKIKPYTFALK